MHYVLLRIGVGVLGDCRCRDARELDKPAQVSFSTPALFMVFVETEPKPNMQRIALSLSLFWTSGTHICFGKTTKRGSTY